jgi:hypothetical protein
MDIHVTPPVGQSPRPDDQSSTLRLNQRLSAEVVEVSGVNVVLSVKGTPIVAKLTDPGDAAQLTERRVAQFVVKNVGQDVVELQLLQTNTDAQTAIQISTKELSAQLLKQLGFVPTDQNLDVAKALLSRGLTLSHENMHELLSILSNIPKWGAAEAEMAASIKAAGLPLTAETIKMAMQPQAQLHESLQNLQSRLQTLMARDPQLAQSGQKAMEFLNSLVLDWRQSPEVLSEKLSQVIAKLGGTIEGDIGKALQEGTKLSSDSNLLSLANLRSTLQQTGNGRVANQIEDFINGMRVLHWMNTNGDVTGGKGQWLSMELPLSINPTQNQGYFPAKLKISYRNNGETREIDPNFTRMVIQVEVDKGEKIEVDFSIVAKQIISQVTASNHGLALIAEEEFHELGQNLIEMGFDLKSNRFKIGNQFKADQSNLDVPKNSSSLFHSVNLEV